MDITHEGHNYDSRGNAKYYRGSIQTCSVSGFTWQVFARLDCICSWEVGHGWRARVAGTVGLLSFSSGKMRSLPRVTEVSQMLGAQKRGSIFSTY